VEIVSDSDLAKLEKGHITANTDKNTQWAMNNVRQWLQHRNASAQEKCPEDLFSSSTPYPDEELCKWLCRALSFGGS